MDTHNSVQSTIVIGAPRQRVFTALTEAVELQRWFATTAQTEPHTGGQFRLTWEFADAQHNGTQEGAFLAVTPGEVVSLPWKVGPDTAEITTLTFTLSGENGATAVSVQHSGWGADEAAQQEREIHGQLWGFFLSNLKSYVEEGRDERAAQLGQVVKSGN